ncbi:hypothetical protein EDD85DRAFT_995841 [Armillaria nabsnona]|nr:hypothetical protein EDD85DRAFT_995841 [Armillaria nabsnona]
MELLAILPFLLLHLTVAGQLINHTIDDTLGDELTGFKVQYCPYSQPSNGSALVWKNALQCSDCAIVPDRSLAMNDTWTSATYFSSLGNMSAELTFHGSAIYIYLIVSNYPQSTGLVSEVICDFRMDGEIVGSYNHMTDGTYRFEYDVLAYNNTALNDDDHTFLIETTGTQSSYIIFDYALYTNSQPSVTGPTTQSPGSTTSESVGTSRSSVYVSSSSSSSLAPSSSAVPLSPHSVKALTAGITVGVSALIIFPVSLVLYIRRRRRRVNESSTLEIETQSRCSFPPLTRAIQQPAPVLGISLDYEDHFQESFPAQFVTPRPHSKQFEKEESYRESTLTRPAGGVIERRVSVVHNRDLVVEELHPNGRNDFPPSTAISRSALMSEWFY